MDSGGALGPPGRLHMHHLRSVVLIDECPLHARLEAGVGLSFFLSLTTFNHLSLTTAERPFPLVKGALQAASDAPGPSQWSRPHPVREGCAAGFEHTYRIVLFDTIRYDTIPYHTIPYDSAGRVRCSATQSCTCAAGRVGQQGPAKRATGVLHDLSLLGTGLRTCA